MTAVSQGSWQPAGAADDVWEGEMTFQQLGDGTSVLLVNTDGAVRAFHGLCPHQENSLEDADFDGEIITCLAHMWEFDARSGAGVNPTTTCLPEYPVEIRDGELYVHTSSAPPEKEAGPE
ncbi:Rieske 2Fe-2S domain-containing protein [Pseudonocardia endophytica]|uniref:Toluene monooxygenase system ferredoxin subunit n=1 Tax=Pseudonocardia endophytica TaxID=401976 RepID=A0A4R1HYV7_PSEEN|nr:Rieske 2Fe-2S domain-containing protein [Pseudonocardia endophytica]TCK27598.1 toluene monooxygenase system ferredoxin subunit [Pseudonocardia endophytica]